MSIWSYETPLLYWSLSSGISLICLFFTTSILFFEGQKRMQPDHLIFSKLLCTFSYLCIVLGPISCIIHSAAYVPGVCLIYRFVSIPSGYLHIVSMQCYQLSRLYYCFSRKQVHSDSGYPKWIFTILLSILICYACCGIFVNCSTVTTQCSIQSDGVAVTEVMDGIPMWYFEFGRLVLGLLYIALESITLSLYWYKVRSIRCSLRKNQNIKDRPIYERVESILHRVLILTYLYLFICAVMNVLWITHSIANSVVFYDFDLGLWIYSVMSLSISYSMFLMQEHNTKEYRVFLRFIVQYKCTWCFCCFGSMVREQCRMLIDNVDRRTVQKMTSGPTLRDKVSPIEYGNNTTGMELSIATKTEIKTIPSEQ